MKERCEELYRQMMLKIEKCRRLLLCELDVAGQGFRIACGYWHVVKGMLATYTFKNPDEEVAFFKSIKPSFTSQIEFYELVYHALLFKPEEKQDLLILFWQEEANKICRFKKINSAFLEAYLNDNTSLDEIYFLRVNCDPTLLSHSRLYDTDKDSSTYFDNLVAAWLAQQLYFDYVQQKIRELRID